MRALFAALLLLHGTFHLLGFVGSLEALAAFPVVSRALGLSWLVAATLWLAAGGLVLAAHPRWWLPTALGLTLSQALILGAWEDARWGTLVNLIILLPLSVRMADMRAGSLRSLFVRDALDELGRRAPPEALVEAPDLASLPPQVRRYLMRAGVVGRPHVRNYHARFRAEMRRSPEGPWMPATAEQHGFFGPTARLFFLRAWRGPVHFDALHRYQGSRATMQVRVAGLWSVVDAGGPELTQSETVTVLNDMFVLAPAALLDAEIEWAVLDERRVRAIWENAGQRVTALVVFDEHGDLADFQSEDRYQSDGRTHRLLPWSTPVGGYRDFGGVRLPAEGEARWRESSGDWSYGRFLLEEIRYNVGEGDLAAQPRAFSTSRPPTTRKSSRMTRRSALLAREFLGTPPAQRTRLFR